VAGRPVRPAAIDSDPLRDCDSKNSEAMVSLSFAMLSAVTGSIS